jgi:hypothetical protein
MNYCCSNNLGRFPHNQIIDTGIVTTITGTHIVRLAAANGNTFELRKEIEEPETIKFEIGELNESMEYTFTIEKPDGTFISVSNCETFKLKTIINTQIDGCTNSCDDADPVSPYYN